MSEAQAAERLFARYQSEPDQGEEGETRGDEPQPEEYEEVDPEGEEPVDPEGDPESDPDEDEGEPEAPQTFKVKVDGEEVEVPLDELLKGYSREQDYTRKTQAVAEQRKAAEAEAKALADARTEYSSRLEQLASVLQANEPKVDQSLRQSNPAEWSAQMHQLRQWQEQKVALEAEQTRTREEAAREEAKQRDEYVRQERERMLSAIPEWKDETVAQAEQASLYAYAVERAGLSPEEADQIADHRVVTTLRKAMLYDQLMAKKPEAKARVEAVKTAAPGARSNPTRATEERKARERLANDGSTDAAVQLLLSRSRQRRA